MDLDALLSAIQTGDADAFARFVAGAELAIRASLRPFSSRVDTEAVLQEALLRVWQVAPRFVSDGKPNALLRFSIRTAKNRAIDEVRRARVSGVEESRLARLVEEQSHAEATPPPDPMLRRAFEECRDRLPTRPASALTARLESGGESDETLATVLGMTANTFLQNFTRARKLLANCLEKKGIVIGGAT